MGTQKEIKRKNRVIKTISEDGLTRASQNDIQRLLDECQGFHYAQSGNFSKLSRSLVFGIIGTIWVISYSKQGFSPSNNCLLWSLIVSFLYLAVDVCHYFGDSCFYRSEYFNFEKEKEVLKHDERMKERARKSFKSLIAKFAILIIICILFIVGFVQQYNVIEKLFC